jgi:lipopolysaccharide/colanic/teichoic acid biosynthesis glycosyltransferase
VRRLAPPLFYAGIVGTVLGLAKAHAVAHGYDLTGSSRFAWSLAYAVLVAGCAYGAGLPDLLRSRRSAAVATLASTGTAAVGISVLQLVAGSALLPRFVVLMAPAVLSPFSLVCSRLARDGRAHDGRRDRVVVAAGLAAGAELTDELEGNPERPAVVVAVIEPRAAAGAGEDGRPLVAVAERTGATAVVLDRAAQADDSVVAQAAQLHESGLRIRTLSLFYEEWLGKLPVSELERVSLMFDIGELHRARYGRMKRVLDTAVAAVGAGALLAVSPLVVLANLMANRGPLLYRQARVGKNGRVFEILKFRTMAPAESGRGDWTSEDDPRVTPFGSWLRRTHLDELPQVLNVLRGQLSIIGPRPEQPRYVETLEAKLPFYRLRHLVRPGMTGWAQVKYPYGSSDGDALEKLQYEFYYLRHQGLALDLRIIGRTLRSVVRRSGR